MLFAWFLGLGWGHSDPEVKCHSGGAPFHCHGMGMVSYLPHYPDYAEEEEVEIKFQEVESTGSWRHLRHKNKSEYSAVSPLNVDDNGAVTSLKFTCIASKEVNISKLQLRIHLDTNEHFEAAIYDLPIHVFSNEASEMQLVSERWFVFLSGGTLVLQLTEDLFFEPYGADLSDVSLERLFSGDKAFLYVQDEGYVFDLTGAKEAIEQVYKGCRQAAELNKLD